MLVYEVNDGCDKKVTIGMCAKNAEKIMEDAILSIINQSIDSGDIEFIFVDDGSTDNTLNTMVSYLDKLFFKLKIFSQDWRGLGPTRNLIFRESVGKYIIWVDADQILAPDMVEKLLEYMENNDDVGISKGIIGILEGSSTVAILEMMYHRTAQLMDVCKVLRPLGTGGSIYRREALLEIDGFDETLTGVGEDMDAESRIKKKGWILRRVPWITWYEKCRPSWRELWAEYSWHGKGAKKVNKKDVQIVGDYNFFSLPFKLIILELRRAIYAYRMTGKKIALLLPIHWLFKRLAWFYGYVSV